MKMKFLIVIVTIVVLSGCSESQVSLPSIVVSDDPWEVTLEVAGELQAASETTIAPPAGAGWGLTLDWIAEPNISVQSGDVIARIDGTEVEKKLAEAAYEIRKLDIDRLLLQRGADTQLQNLAADQTITQERLEAADYYFSAIVGDENYARIDVIDAMENRHYLDARTGYLTNQKSKHEEKSAAEEAVLQSRINAQDTQVQMQRNILGQLEMVAPHDGILVHKANWSGEYPKPGDSLFPGRAIASLPDLSKMQAEVNVPESQALGLKEGLSVTIWLDAYPERPLKGSIATVSHAAQSKERGNPAKFFTVTVDLDEADPSWITPGQRVRGEIILAQPGAVVSVPNQALFEDGQDTWVYVRDGNAFKRRSVQIGIRGLTRSSVENGLNAGESIALVSPEEAE